MTQLTAFLERFRKIFGRNKIISSTFFQRRQRWDEWAVTGQKVRRENKLLIWYCGNKVVVWVARDKGELVNGAVGNTIEVGALCCSECGCAQAREHPPVSFLHPEQPCHVPQLLPGPPHHWGLSYTVGTGETCPFLTTAPILLSQSEFCYSIKWKKNHGSSEDGVMHRS